MCSLRKEKQKEAAEKLAEYLGNKLNLEAGYPEEPTWGYAFTALFFHSLGKKIALREKSLKFLSLQNIKSKEFSWEFVVFCLSYLNKDGVVIPSELQKNHEKGTRMFNWFLLRCHNRLQFKENYILNKYKLDFSLYLYQKNDGLILDEFKTRSLHYHAFCLFVIAHILKLNNSDYLRNVFERGVFFARKHILRDGTSLYIGRGQEQIFGYGSLLYALEYYNSNIAELDDGSLELVTNRIISFQRDNGSFPLVLRTLDIEHENVSFKNDFPDGWHGYNTLYDYLPFLGYCLSESSKLK
ncbi:hypothetical protein VCSRO187_3471 [Vibrio cholerae]|nr:hypothetical protein [Vibrio cholerae]GIB53077.1 hypothetical protein VCSRO187_3471 [Vibrio cholerae]